MITSSATAATAATAAPTQVAAGPSALATRRRRLGEGVARALTSFVTGATTVSVEATTSFVRAARSALASSRRPAAWLRSRGPSSHAARRRKCSAARHPRKPRSSGRVATAGPSREGTAVESRGVGRRNGGGRREGQSGTEDEEEVEVEEEEGPLHVTTAGMSETGHESATAGGVRPASRARSTAVGPTNGARLMTTVGPTNGDRLMTTVGPNNGARLITTVGTTNGAHLMTTVGTTNGAHLMTTVGRLPEARPVAARRRPSPGATGRASKSGGRGPRSRRPSRTGAGGGRRGGSVVEWLAEERPELRGWGAARRQI